MKTKSYFPNIIAGAAGALVASAIPLLLSNSHADTKLLPFQGRLTDANGAAIADGAKVVEFKLYDAPTGGNVKWAGEVHKLSVNGGLVNTMLGSKAGLGSVDFSTPSFLQITVDANGDSSITAADPPLLPRQSVVSAVYANEAGNARKLNNSDWSAIMVDANGIATNAPVSGFVSGGKLRDGSISSKKFAQDLTFDGTTTGTFSGNGSALTNLTTANLTGLVGSAQIASGGVDGQSIVKDGTQTNGVKWATVWQVNRQIFTSNGTFTTPSGTTTLTVYKITCIGGGGSGASAAGSTGAGGGGGGGTAIKDLSGLAPGSTRIVTIGTGGASVAGNGRGGNDGNSTSVGTDCVASGGKGGATNAGLLLGGAGGIGTTGDILVGGSAGGGGYNISGVANFGGIGGGTSMGGGGTTGAGNNNGGAGQSYGGGGGGSSAGSTGTGAAGFVVIEWNQ